MRFLAHVVWWSWYLLILGLLGILALILVLMYPEFGLAMLVFWLNKYANNIAEEYERWRKSDNDQIHKHS